MSSKKDKKKSSEKVRSESSEKLSKRQSPSSPSRAKSSKDGKVSTDYCEHLKQYFKKVNFWCVRNVIPVIRYICGFWFFGIFNLHHPSLQIPPFKLYVPICFLMFFLISWCASCFWAMAAKFESFKASVAFADLSDHLLISDTCTRDALNALPMFPQVVALHNCQIPVTSQTYSNDYINFSTKGPARITYFDPATNRIFKEYIFTHEMFIGGLAPHASLMHLLFESVPHLLSSPQSLEGRSGLSLSKFKWTDSILSGRVESSTGDRRVYLYTSSPSAASSAAEAESFEMVSVDALASHIGRISLLGVLKKVGGADGAVSLFPDYLPGEEQLPLPAGEIDFAAKYEEMRQNQVLYDVDAMQVRGSIWGGGVGSGVVDRVLDEIEGRVRVIDGLNQSLGMEIASLVFVVLLHFLMLSSLFTLAYLLLVRQSKLSCVYTLNQLKTNVTFNKNSQPNANSRLLKQQNEPLLQNNVPVESDRSLTPITIRLRELRTLFIEMSDEPLSKNQKLSPEDIEGILNIPTDHSALVATQHALNVSRLPSSIAPPPPPKPFFRPIWTFPLRFPSTRRLLQLNPPVGGLMVWLAVTSFVEWTSTPQASASVFMILAVSAACVLILSTVTILALIFVIPIFGKHSLKSEVALKWQPCHPYDTEDSENDLIAGAWIVDGKKSLKEFSSSSSRSPSSKHEKSPSSSSSKSSSSKRDRSRREQEEYLPAIDEGDEDVEEDWDGEDREERTVSRSRAVPKVSKKRRMSHLHRSSARLSNIGRSDEKESSRSNKRREEDDSLLSLTASKVGTHNIFDEEDESDQSEEVDYFEDFSPSKSDRKKQKSNILSDSVPSNLLPIDDKEDSSPVSGTRSATSRLQLLRANRSKSSNHRS